MSTFNPTLPPTERRLATLDGWRAISILMVLVSHGAVSLEHAIGPGAAGLAAALHHLGFFGVHCFFAISGLLITTRLIEEQKRNGSIDLRAFYVRRAFRILPLLFLYLAVIAFLAALGLIAVDPLEWLGAFGMFANYVDDTTWFVSHFWSLAIEEHFYLFWPCVLLVFRFERAAKPAVALIALLAIWRTADWHLQILDGQAVNFWKRTDIQLPLILWGALIALLWATPRYEKWLRVLLRGTGWWVVVAIVIANELRPLPLHGTWQPALLALVVLGTVAYPERLAGKLLERRSLRWIGRMSYSLYVWQQLYTYGGSERLPVHLFPLNLVLAFVTAALAYYFVEKPMIRLGRRLAKRTSGLRSSSAVD